MERIVCEVDDSPAAGEAVRAAIVCCQDHGGELELVGIVRESIFEAPQPAIGERIRRYKAVQQALRQATALANEAGLRPEIALRVGDPVKELMREGEATGASEGFLGRAHGRLAALLTGRPRVEVKQLVLGGR